MRENDAYFLGPRIFQFAQSILANHPFGSVLRGVMNDLVKQTGETVLYAVRDGDRVVYSSVIESPQPVRYVAQTGVDRPLFCSASGLVMLAYDTPEELDAYFERTELTPLTGNSITDETHCGTWFRKFVKPVTPERSVRRMSMQRASEFPCFVPMEISQGLW